MSKVTVTAKACTNKTCIHEGKLQPTSNFHRRSRNKSGLAAWCKDCKRAHAEVYNRSQARKDSLDRYVKTDKFKANKKRFRQSEKGKATQRRYNQSEKGKATIHRRYLKQKNDPVYQQKQAARIAVRLAVERGDLPHVSDLTCDVCKSPAQEYHHHLGYDETNWLDVTPLCIQCHRDIFYNEGV